MTQTQRAATLAEARKGGGAQQAVVVAPPKAADPSADHKDKHSKDLRDAILQAKQNIAARNTENPHAALANKVDLELIANHEKELGARAALQASLGHRLAYGQTAQNIAKNPLPAVLGVSALALGGAWYLNRLRKKREDLDRYHHFVGWDPDHEPIDHGAHGLPAHPQVTYHAPAGFLPSSAVVREDFEGTVRRAASVAGGAARALGSGARSAVLASVRAKPYVPSYGPKTWAGILGLSPDHDEEDDSPLTTHDLQSGAARLGAAAVSQIAQAAKSGLTQELHSRVSGLIRRVFRGSDQRLASAASEFLETAARMDTSSGADSSPQLRAATTTLTLVSQLFAGKPRAAARALRRATARMLVQMPAGRD